MDPDISAEPLEDLTVDYIHTEEGAVREVNIHYHPKIITGESYGDMGTFGLFSNRAETIE